MKTLLFPQLKKQMNKNKYLAQKPDIPIFPGHKINYS